MRAVNLLPPEDRTRAAIAPGRAGGTVYAVFGLLAGLAILAFMYGSAAHTISSDKSEIASLTVRAQQAQARASALTPYTSFAAMREQREQAVQTLVDSRFDWASAFRELGRVLPASVSLSSLSGQVGSSANAGSSSSSSSSGASGSSTVSSATPAGSVPTFTIAGCATSQEQVAVMLDRLRLIPGVSEVALQSSTKGGASGASAGASSGGCEASDPSFNATVTFDALPNLPTSTSTASTVSATSGASGASAGGSASSGSNGNSGPGESVDGVSSNRASSAAETAR